FSLKSPTGHFRIIIGHEVVGNNDTEIMTYHDPVSGSFQTMKKEVFQELWRPNTSGYVDIRIPNQMVATLKEPFISTNDECVFCKNPDIETKQVNTEEAYPDYTFIYPEGKGLRNGTSYVCQKCGVKVVHFEH
ncbi:MAG: hypothetical protein IIC67_12525, partial [Thaumarchaeota archaeon]|nr:hypothetical protein [Nitrososphaerota archaeon]